MKELPKSTNEANGKVYPKLCPVCNIATNYIYLIEDAATGDKSEWYQCQNGVIFQKNLPDWKHDKKPIVYEDKEKETYAARIYASLIEELTFGRMMLSVGCFSGSNIRFFENRGWLTWGIEINDNFSGSGNLYKGDFETYDFSLKIDREELKKKIGTDKIKDRTFDLIWLPHILEHFKDPITALKKAYNLLSETGVIYISTPDIEFIYKQGVSAWGYWKKNKNYIMWSEPALKREVERMGFKVIMSRRNFASRFPHHFDIHLIAQKAYF